MSLQVSIKIPSIHIHLLAYLCLVMLKSTLDSSIHLHQIFLHHVHHPLTHPHIWSPNKYSRHVPEISPKFHYKRRHGAIEKKRDEKEKKKRSGEKRKKKKKKIAPCTQMLQSFKRGCIKKEFSSIDHIHIHTQTNPFSFDRDEKYH